MNIGVINRLHPAKEDHTVGTDGKWMGDSIIKDRQWSEPHSLSAFT